MTLSFYLSSLSAQIKAQRNKDPGSHGAGHSNHSIDVNKTHFPEESPISGMSQLLTAV